ncbi:major facilitator superfamily domain-containing protein [Aspergillus floccosus]
MEELKPATSYSPTTEGDLVTSTVVEDIPGTRLLVEENATHLVYLPRPSASPDDPLNWCWVRKYKSMLLVCFWVLLLGGATLSPAVTYGPLIQEMGVTVNYLNIAAAIALLLLGLGNLVFNPIALRFGRRPVYLASAIISMVANIVVASSKSKGAYMAGRIVLGFGAAPFEQLPALTIDDQFFIHRRGFGLSLYTFALNIGSFLGPVASGFVTDSMGWRWMHWWYAIFLGLSAVLIFLFLEETAFVRRTQNNLPIMERGSSAEGPRKTIVQRLKLFTHVESPVPFVQLVVGPFKMLLEPIVWWCGTTYGFGVAWLTIMAYESSTVFGNYGFSSAAIGLTNIAPLVGACLSLYAGGAGTDRFMVWKARRNGGVMEAESRIYSVLIAGPIMCGGLVLYGAGAAHHVHWMGPIIGMAMIGSGLPIAAEVTLGYASESYPSLAGEATTGLVCIRNVIGAAMTFGIGPWIDRCGLQDTFVIAGVLAFVVFYSGIFFIWKGKACRRMGAKRYYQMVAKRE